jgi:uncharacterized membrane protein
MQKNSDNTAPGSQSGTGLAPNVAAALSYVLGIVTGIVFLMLEKDRFVRFHAYQSVLLTAAWIVFWIGFSILSTILAFIPFLGFLVAIVGLLLSLGLGLGGLVLWIVLLLKAYQGQTWKLPFIGDMAEKYAAPQ